MNYTANLKCLNCLYRCKLCYIKNEDIVNINIHNFSVKLLYKKWVSFTKHAYKQICVKYVYECVYEF